MQVRDTHLYRTTQEHQKTGRTSAGVAWPSFLFAFGMAELCAWLEVFRSYQHSIEVSEYME